MSDQAHPTTKALAGVRSVHIVGIGGAGMSAIATVLEGMGYRVSGSDMKSSPLLRRLRATGVEVSIGHDPRNVQGADLVTASTAVKDSNPELVEARRRGLPVMSRAAVLSAIASSRRCIAVSGTHGKTTTTSMLALVLVEAGLHPAFLIGGDVNEIGTNAVWDSGEWLVVEADESDGTFLELAPEVAVVTNVEPDHLDYYGSFEALVGAFESFCSSARYRLVAGADNEVSAGLAARHGGVLVGTSERATYRIEGLVTGSSGTRFDIQRDGALLGSLSLAVPGVHNARNAALAAASAMEIGVPFEAAERALARFAGVARRFEARGELAGARFVDDYAHLPGEVEAAIATARACEPDGRIVAVFQPHRYSRTAALHESFGHAFGGVDVLLVTDVYAAGETPVPGVTGRLVAEAVANAHPEVAVAYVPSRAKLVEELLSLLVAGDLCLTLGAGDITSLAEEVVAVAGEGDGPGEGSTP